MNEKNKMSTRRELIKTLMPQIEADLKQVIRLAYAAGKCDAEDVSILDVMEFAEMPLTRIRENLSEMYRAGESHSRRNRGFVDIDDNPVI